MATPLSLSTFLAEVNDNRRLRLGLWAILGIAWLYGLLVLRDEARLAVNEQQSMARKVSRLQAQSSQTEWKARLEQAQSRQIELETRLWREPTIGLAQATFQDWLNQVVQQSGLTRAVVTVAAQDETTLEKIDAVKVDQGTNSDLWKVSAKVGFDFTPKGLYTLASRLEGHDKQITVETLIVRGPPAPRAEMVLVAYFQKTVPAEKMNELSNGKPNDVRPSATQK